MKTISSIILTLLLLGCSNKKAQLDSSVKTIDENDAIENYKIVDTIDYSNILLVNESLKKGIISFINEIGLYPDERREFTLEVLSQTKKEVMFELTYSWPVICHNSFREILDFKAEDATIFLLQKEGELNKSFFELERKCECAVAEVTYKGALVILNGGYRIEPYNATLANIYTFLHFKKIDGKFEFYKEYRDPRTVPKF